MVATFDFFGPNSDFFGDAFFDENGDLTVETQSSSSTLITLRNDANGFVTQVHGTGFNVVNGEPQSGTITGFTFRNGGDTVAAISDISWSAPGFVNALVQDSQGNSGPLMALLNQQPILVDASDAVTGADVDLDGLSTNLFFVGSNFDDYFRGGSGNDVVDSGRSELANGDVVIGSAGNDTINYSNAAVGFYTVDFRELGQAVNFNIDTVANTGSVTGSIGSTGFTTTLNNVARVTNYNITDGLGLTGSDMNDTFNLRVGANNWLSANGRGGDDIYNVTVQTSVRIDFRSGATNGITANLTTGVVANDGTGGTDQINYMGGGGVIEIRGTDFDDSIAGSARNDRFILRAGDDTVDGGGGFDTVRYDRGGYEYVQADLQFRTATAVWNGATGTDTLVRIERLVGTDGDDTLFGDSVDNMLEGGDGNDRMAGRQGDDTIIGGAGTDRVIYSVTSTSITVTAIEGGLQIYSVNEGTDHVFGIEQFQFADGVFTAAQVEAMAGQTTVIVGTNGNDTLTGTAADETLDGRGGADILIGNGGADLHDGGAGRDMADYIGAPGAVTVDFINFAVNTGHAAGDTFINVEDLRGSQFDDDLRGNGLANLINGSNGDDFILGRNGADTLIGADGNDTLSGGDDNDVLNGGEGNDVLSGGNGNDRMLGDNGNDRIVGIAGNNSMIGGSGNDTLYDGAGSSTLFGGTGADRLIGAAGNDRLLGGFGNDRLAGLNGNDTLSGNAGDDYLVGGNGADTFVFQADMGNDRAEDYTVGLDRLFIESSLTGGITDAAQVVATYANVVGGNVVFDFGGGNVINLLGLNSTAGLADDILVT